MSEPKYKVGDFFLVKTTRLGVTPGTIERLAWITYLASDIGGPSYGLRMLYPNSHVEELVFMENSIDEFLTYVMNFSVVPIVIAPHKIPGMPGNGDSVDRVMQSAITCIKHLADIADRAQWELKTPEQQKEIRASFKPTLEEIAKTLISNSREDGMCVDDLNHETPFLGHNARSVEKICQYLQETRNVVATLRDGSVRYYHPDYSPKK